MNGKNIKAVLSRKFNDFLDSIEDKEVKKLVKENTIITGGAIVSMLQGEEVNDFDLYFTNKETVLAVANYYVEKFRAAHSDRFSDTNDLRVRDIDAEAYYNFEDNGDPEGHRDYVPEGRVKIFIRSKGTAAEKNAEVVTDETEEPVFEHKEGTVVTPTADTKELPKYRPVWLSANAITLSDKIQLIIRFYGDAETIHSNYDFVHCTSYWTSKDRQLVLRPEALEAILAKELRYVGSKYPVCSIIRTRKFLARGFTINAGQYFKMCLQVSQLNLLDIKVLEDQLIGVDSAYFNEIICMVANKKEKEPDWELDQCFLVELINKIF